MWQRKSPLCEFTTPESPQATELLMRRYNLSKAYVTYTYDGRTFTVYDEDYSARSTAEVARKIVESEFERTEVKEYIQAHIIDRLSAV